MKADELRGKFLGFFKENGHKILPSDSLAPMDTSLLFTSAGMNQFKPYFLGEKKDLSRAATCQKCLRTADLENVGKTTYHQTFFEMLGNFSFGDYFKKQAITFAWEFLTGELNIKKDKLWVSVYKDDPEAFELWKDFIGVEPGRIVKLGAESNFWPADALLKGPDGPCGPCSEIFFDYGRNTGCGRERCSPACDCGRFVEVWNLVFTQFNRMGRDNLTPLPRRNIDTGMGLERLCSLLQGKTSNFEIDILFPAVNLINGLFNKESGEKADYPAINAIADHSRAVIFAIADGIYPSNDDRGYVIRKLIRKALYHGYMLGKKEPFLYQTVGLFAELMRTPYPEIEEKKEDISSVIIAEEEKFFKTLESGKSHFQAVLDSASKEARSISGEEAFKLYDTYGFSIELIKDLAGKQNITVETESFNSIFQKQREMSRDKSMFDRNIFSQEVFPVKTATAFIGYEQNSCQTRVTAIVKDNREAGALSEGEEGCVILEETPFYPESGGQCSDSGIIKSGTGEFLVEKVRKINETIVHAGRVISGMIDDNSVITAYIDEKNRQAVTRAHTATHLLQAALRLVLGTHVAQQGSFVDIDKLRFDFTHLKKVTREELREVEKLVNEYVLASLPVEKRVVPYEQAKREKALAFFEDKYSDEVRVIDISPFSRELCGGTHLDNTSQIGTFQIISETSVSSGIRRIEAFVGNRAYENFVFYRDNCGKLAEILKVKDRDVLKRVENSLLEIKNQREKINKLERDVLCGQIDTLIDENREDIKGVTAVLAALKDKNYQDLLYLSDCIRGRIKTGIAFIYSLNPDKNIFVLAVTPDLTKDNVFSGSEFIREYRDILGLRGGGNPALSQGVIRGEVTSGFRKTLSGALKKFFSK